MQWNQVIAGRMPSPENILVYAKKYLLKNDEKLLLNWYSSEIEELDMAHATLVCQRTNLWWDTQLRRQVAWCVLAFISAITFFVLFLLNDRPVSLPYILFSLLPFYEVTIDYIRSQFSSVNKMLAIKEVTENILDKIVNNRIKSKDLQSKLRVIQDEIFRHREACLFVPDFFYMIFRANQETLMNQGAKHYVDLITSRQK